MRLPAAACGLVGVIIPGRLSVDGILPNCYSLDVPGPLTWTVGDAAMVFDALLNAQDHGVAGRSLIRATARPITGLRVGVLRGPLGRFPEPDTDIAAAFEGGVRVLEHLGANV